MSSSDVAFTLENLASINKAIAAGTKKVKYSDKEKEYMSLDDLLRIKGLMEASLGIKTSCGKNGLFGGRRINAIHSKGLDDC